MSLSDLTPFLGYGAFFVVLYFLLIRPQQKRAKEAQEMLNTLQVGSHIITIGGLHGVVDELTDKTVVIDCDGVYLTFERRAVARIVSSPTATTTVADLQPKDIVEEVVESTDAEESAQ